MRSPNDPLWPYPTGHSNQQEIIAAAALPAAGAWTTPVAQLSAYAQTLHLHFTYTRGGVGGAFDYYLEISPYSATATVPAGQQEWQRLPIYAPGAVVPGADTASDLQAEYFTYQATGATAEDFAVDVPFSGNVERYRVTARESGAVGTPGTLGIVGELA